MLSYGDFNIDLLKSESCDYTNRFLEQLFTSSCMPLILRPTRITEHTATLIDNIFTNDIENIESSTNGIIFSDISDHLPIVHMYVIQKYTLKLHERPNSFVNILFIHRLEYYLYYLY